MSRFDNRIAAPPALPPIRPPRGYATARETIGRRGDRRGLAIDGGFGLLGYELSFVLGPSCGSAG